MTGDHGGLRSKERDALLRVARLMKAEGAALGDHSEIAEHLIEKADRLFVCAGRLGPPQAPQPPQH